MANPIVRHSKVVTVPDDPNYPVGSDEWNANHVITGLENVPNIDTSNAANVNFAQAGTGAVTRSVLSALSEFPTSTDWDTGAHALAAAQGLLWVPNGAPTLPALPFTTGSFPNTAQFYMGPAIDWNPSAPTGTGENAHLMLSVQHAGNHTTSSDASLAISTSPVGSGGPGGTGDVSLVISNIKQNFQTTAISGDLSGLNIVVRNGGPDTGPNHSDTAALNLDVASIGTPGQLFAFEAISRNSDRLGVLKWQVDAQVCSVDTQGGNAWAYTANIDAGAGSAAFLAQATAVGASWGRLLQYVTNPGGERFAIGGDASIKMCPTDGTSVDFITLVNTHSTSGKFRVLNTGGTEIFAVEGSSGQVSAASYSGQFVSLTGSTSGATRLQPSAVASGTIILPAATGTVALTNNNLGVFGATTSAQLAGVLTDETGTGSLVFSNSPSFTTPNLGSAIATQMGVGGPVVAGRILSVSSNGQPSFAFQGTSGGAGNKIFGWIYDPGTALSAPGIVLQNLDDSGGFVANSAVIWRDGTLTLGSITKYAGADIALEHDRGLRLNNQTSAAAAAAGTLTNAPVAGNPGHWLKINIGGTNYAIPCWLG